MVACTRSSCAWSASSSRRCSPSWARWPRHSREPAERSLFGGNETLQLVKPIQHDVEVIGGSHLLALHDHQEAAAVGRHVEIPIGGERGGGCRQIGRGNV